MQEVAAFVGENPGRVGERRLAGAEAAQRDVGAVAEGGLVDDRLAVDGAGDRGGGAAEAAHAAVLAIAAGRPRPEVELVFPEPVEVGELVGVVEEAAERDHLHAIGEALVVGPPVGVGEEADIDLVGRRLAERQVGVPPDGARGLPGDGDVEEHHVNGGLGQRRAGGVGDRRGLGGGAAAVAGGGGVGDQAAVAEPQREAADRGTPLMGEDALASELEGGGAAGDQAGRETAVVAGRQRADGDRDADRIDAVLGVHAGGGDGRDVGAGPVERIVQRGDAGIAAGAEPEAGQDGQLAEKPS